MHIFLNKNISKNLTGIEHSSLNRFKIFKLMGLNVGYATITLNFEILEFAKKYEIGINQLYNPYLFFLEFDKLEYKKINMDLSGFNKIYLKNNDIKVFDGNKLLMYVGFDENANLKFINYFVDKINFKREIYLKGNKVLEILFSSEIEKKRSSELYYNCVGEKIIEKKYKECGVEIDVIIVLRNNEIKYFFNEDDFIRYWLVEQCLNYSGKVFFYIDRPLRYNKAVSGLEGRNVVLVGMIHAIHYNHYRSHMIGNLLTGYKQYFDNINIFDSIVVGTELQKNDLKERFNVDNKVSVIPPSSIKQVHIEKKCQNSDFKKFISVGRLSPEKRIDHIVEALNIVFKRGYKFNLKIFGAGPEYSMLNDLIVKYELQNSIQLCGYSYNIIDEIKKSDFSLVASCYEGFNISIIESFSCGSPVLAYDVKYGPKELIRNNDNGFLIDDGNISNYAEKLIEIIEGKVDLVRMSTLAIESSICFNEDALVKRWRELISRFSLN